MDRKLIKFIFLQRAVIEKLLNKSKSKREEKNETVEKVSRQPLDLNICYCYRQKITDDGPQGILVLPKDISLGFIGSQK